MKQLQKGHDIGFIPAEKSPAASNPSRIRRERQLVLKGRARLSPIIIPLAQVLEFEASGRRTRIGTNLLMKNFSLK